MDKKEWYTDYYNKHRGSGYMLDPAVWLASWQATEKVIRRVSQRAAVTDARLTLARLDARKPPPAPARR